MQSKLYAAILTVLCVPLSAQEIQVIDKDLMNDPHFREEHGLNSYTRPSIDDIFEQLDKLAPIPLNEVPFVAQKRMAIEREDLAIELGFLISEGFLAVQSGDMKKVQQLAATLSKYANALGAGEKVKGHAASILAYSKNNEIDKLKKALVVTQEDVEKELILLQDIDLAHLISLGGWLRALEVSAYSVNKKFTQERATLLYREDIADYYEYALSSMKPELKEKESFKTMLASMTILKQEMLLENNKQPSQESVAAIHHLTVELVKNALSREQ